MNKLDLAKLAMDTKRVEFEVPGFKDFKITLSYLSRQTLHKIRQESMIQRFTQDGYPTQELDVDLYLDKYSKAVFVGWKGLTYEVASQLLLLDESQIEDMSEEIEFSVETAVFLQKNSERFDNWVTSTISKLDNFRK